MIDFAKTVELPQGQDNNEFARRSRRSSQVGDNVENSDLIPRQISHRNMWVPTNHEDGYMLGLSSLLEIWGSSRCSLCGHTPVCPTASEVEWGGWRGGEQCECWIHCSGSAGSIAVGLLDPLHPRWTPRLRRESSFCRRLKTMMTDGESSFENMTLVKLVSENSAGNDDQL